MPLRARWYHRLAALAPLFAVALGTQALLASSAGAAGFVPISGSGSAWASNALDQWRRGLSNLDGMTVSFFPDGSTNSRNDFRDGRVDYAVSELPYGRNDGGVADPPQQITNRADPAIEADNPGVALPARPIVGPDEGRTLSELAYYAVCDGQQRVDALSYSPLPINLLQAAADQVNQITGATQKIKSTDLGNCHNPRLSPDGTDQLIKDVPQPQPCDRRAALTQCAGGTGDATTPTATTVTVNVSPASPLAAKTMETLTATIRPSAVAGSVQFKDGPGNVGGPVTVSGGTASTTTTLTPGTHSLTAVFIPTETSAVSGSVSEAMPVVVSPPAGAKATKTTFLVVPSGTVVQSTPVILVAQVTPVDAAGTVQFMDGDTALGSPRPVFAGFALTVTSKLAPGAHALTAVYTPAAQAAFELSVPPPVSLTVIGLP
jgi:Big-like domain-containing protein